MTHWEILDTQDADLNEKIQAWRNHINNTKLLERKYKELIMVSNACILRFAEGIISHAQFALDFGATKEELLAAIEQSFFMGGVPAFRQGMLAFYEMFKAEIDEKRSDGVH
jgi:alkylhydroperoxidase/carboxymuconolactone decarboxylase family protein YurZ